MKRAACSLLASLSALAITGTAEAGISCYGGATLGYASAEAEAQFTLLGFAIPAGDLDGDGVAGGLTGGCDWTSGRWLVGGWGDLTWHGAELSVSFPLVGGTLAELPIDTQWSVGGRAGYFITERTLAYGLIGWSRVETGGFDVPLAGVSLDTPNVDGLVVGGGIEVEVAPQITIGAEYRYTSLEEQKFDIVPGLIGLNLDTEIHSVRGVAKYRFDLIR